MLLLTAVVCGFCLDALLGDPQGGWHPIVVIGKLIGFSESRIRKRLPKTEWGAYIGGILLWLCTAVPSFFIPFLLLLAARSANAWLYFAAETLFCCLIFAARSLKRESMRVHDALKSGDLPAARGRLARIVGRDTENLDEEQIVSAAVETVAENTSDGVTAPLLYMLLGGASLGFLYKAVNTLDSMVGYKNDDYLHFGRFSAKADDLFNFIPARLTGLLMVPAAFLLGLDAKGAARIFFRDRKKHKSPNSAHTEAACAGALGLLLGGDATYFGKRTVKPTIGDPRRRAEAADIRMANRLMYMTAVLSLLLFGGVRLVICLLCL